MGRSTGFLSLLKEADIDLGWFAGEIKRDVSLFYKWEHADRCPNKVSRLRIKEKLRNKISEERISRVLENIEQRRFV